MYVAPIAAATGIVAGGVLYAFAGSGAADVAWAATVAIMLVPLTWSVLRSLLHGDLGVDVIALLAMAGALALGEYLAGAVIALMLAGGNALEVFASARARRELTALVERAPRSARRRTDDAWEEIPAEEVEVGDVLLVRAGEVIPTDGALASEHATIDESSAHGRAAPGGLRARAADPQRLLERGQRVRAERHPTRRRQRLRGARAAGARSGAPPRAVRADGGPLRRLLSPAHALHRRRRVADLR